LVPSASGSALGSRRWSQVRAGRAALAVVPAGWVLIEAIRSWSALGGPWGLIGASQWRAPAFLAPASLGGVWLVSFLIIAANVAVMVMIESRTWRERSAAALAVVALLAVGPIWYSFESPPRGTARLDVAVVQAGVVHDPQQRLDDEIAATGSLPAGHFGLVIWGESSVGFDLLTRTDVRRRLADVSSRLGADLLVNVDAAAPGGAIRKTAVLIGPTGIISSYRKMRLVPFGEYIPLRFVLGWLASVSKAAATNRVRGHEIVVMSTDAVTFAPLICFESAFPDMSRSASRAGAQLLVFQSATTTFQGTWAPDQHASLAAVRAVETGRTTVQATLAGTTAAFDAQGHRQLWWSAEDGTVAVILSLATRTTPYDRFGNWVLALCLVVVTIAATTMVRTPAQLVGRRRRRSIRPAPSC
jgi:apolipoprotein N-acyltransferase